MPSIPMTGTTPMRRREHNRQENMFVKDEAGTADGDERWSRCGAFTHKSLHREVSTQKSFRTQTHFHTKPFKYRGIYKKVLTQRVLYAQTSLHTQDFTHRSLYT